jgi:hypothetical protein
VKTGKSQFRQGSVGHRNLDFILTVIKETTERFKINDIISAVIEKSLWIVVWRSNSGYGRSVKKLYDNLGERL